jgi:hypothetical protein
MSISAIDGLARADGRHDLLLVLALAGGVAVEKIVRKQRPHGRRVGLDPCLKASALNRLHFQDVRLRRHRLAAGEQREKEEGDRESGHDVRSPKIPGQGMDQGVCAAATITESRPIGNTRAQQGALV